MEQIKEASHINKTYSSTHVFIVHTSLTVHRNLDLQF
jgi:hypothetical protein